MKKTVEEEEIMHIRLTLQEKLRDLREERGLKLEELSKQIGISKSAVSMKTMRERKSDTSTSVCWQTSTMFRRIIW